MQKRWSKTEIAHLEQHASSASPEELAQKFQTDVDTVRRKLDELRGSGSTNTSDEDLESYTEALKLLYDKKWEQAAKIFERLLEESDSRHFADRVRQSLTICQRQLFVRKEEVDPYLAVVYEKNSGNLEAALKLCLAQEQEQTDERFAYLLASIHAMAGEQEKALDVLETAISLDPKNRIHAYHDPDFADLRGEEDFTNLVSSDKDSEATPSDDTVSSDIDIDIVSGETISSDIDIVSGDTVSSDIDIVSSDIVS